MFSRPAVRRHFSGFRAYWLGTPQGDLWIVRARRRGRQTVAILLQPLQIAHLKVPGLGHALGIWALLGILLPE